MRSRLAAALTATVVLLVTAAPALACGGLIGPNGAVNLLRTTTFAGYADGVEHYVTAFEFAGGGGAFGSLTPLPGIPTSVVKGGDWTLQRLILETDPPAEEAFRIGLFAAAGAADAEVLQEVRIDALDITILRGGGDEVARWATEQGFRLPPDAPEVLDFYAQRSPIFMAAAFDADAAAERGQAVGDGTPVHLTIPTDAPWVPLRILGLGKQAGETIQADVYLLTDEKPRLLPAPILPNGFTLAHSAPATTSLLDDLRSDRDMDWVPADAWLTKLAIDAKASTLTFDLAISPDGVTAPDPVDVGLGFGARPEPEPGLQPIDVARVLAAIGMVGAGLAMVLGLTAHRPVRPAA
ncbi:MAG TPA: DUF2330 domain-containing protein [Candidatus Limnocylindrales bacterium]|nr:DUF2330 domain-containing protein [Candidatus Limnocylindrales bacterium]